MTGYNLQDWVLILLRLCIAALCGGLIGYQRETTERPAGFRTHILVCVGSAVYMLVSVAVGGGIYDPGRIAAQVASGIGFLGAGTIIKQGSIVRGLTTAASLWAVAGIGLAAGYGGPALSIALLGTAIVFLALTTLKQIESRFERGRRSFVLEIALVHPRQNIEWVQQVLANHGVELHSVAITGEQDDVGEISCEGHAVSQEELTLALGELLQGSSIKSIRQQLR